MEILLLSFAIIVIAVLAMAIGVICGRRPIAGSCGGLGQLGLGCEVCEKPCAKKRQALGLESD